MIAVSDFPWGKMQWKEHSRTLCNWKAYEAPTLLSLKKCNFSELLHVCHAVTIHLEPSDSAIACKTAKNNTTQS